MLVLTRKVNEEIVIGNDIRITIVEVAPGRVKIGIQAPRSVPVDRGEIHEQKQAEAVQKPVVVNRIADVLPVTSTTPPVVPPPSAVTHTNRLEAIRRRFPKKPR
jgi:carbon storage regulator